MTTIRIARRYLLLWLALCCNPSAAETPGNGVVMRNLPDLPTPGKEPAYLILDPKLVSVGFKSKTQKWGIRLDEYRSATPSLTLDYGTLLTESLSMGGNLSYKGDHSEALLNTVFAPAQNIRIELTVGELRGYGACPASACGITVQHSYLLGLKKYFDKRSTESSVGVFAYDIESDSGQRDSALSTAADNAAPLMPVRMHGYILSLGLQPNTRSSMDLRHSWGEVTYYTHDSQPQQHVLAAGGVKYTYHFDNCALLQGRYGSSPHAGRLNIGIAKNQWSVSLSHASSAVGDDAVLWIGYAIPLGTGMRKAGECGSSNPRLFSSLVEAAANRPAQLPRAPLVGMDGMEMEMADRIVGW